MTDLERLTLLQKRLQDLEMRIPHPAERAALDVARLALREEIGQLGQSLVRQGYWRTPSAARLGNSA